ncbi:hypothetical protein MY1884_003791 [Beauveria asiatica]
MSNSRRDNPSTEPGASVSRPVIRPRRALRPYTPIRVVENAFTGFLE